MKSAKSTDGRIAIDDIENSVNIVLTIDGKAHTAVAHELRKVVCDACGSYMKSVHDSGY